MGDKKRKLAEETPADGVAPEGKKMKKEKKEKKDKKEKKEKRQAEKEVEVAPEVIEEDKKEKKKKQKKEEANESNESQQVETKEKRESKKAEKAEKKEKKEKRSADKTDLDAEEKAAKKAAKKAKSDKKKAAEEDKESASQEGSTDEPEADASNEAEVTQKSSRFICFVGNLPYSANHESLTKHFEKNPPANIRVATKKEAPSKCRGFAFIEFDNYDRMKTCLKLYHHSMFDDGKYPPRRMNVELTAGGGGSNSEHRKAKIQAKNEKLNDERQRLAKDIKKDKRDHDKGKPARSGVSGANAVTVDGGNDNDQFAGMHPSRRGRI
ncbi:uncharacterized protein N7482_009442 [Penicillium canariense]|uniref:RRM domain-containing protein n=1 Tax=Penicillium canariense TaxID=189055 RepID=A0A9W9LFQ6_9EURO|nr:uncharacterized protein N7482_009442 [Penicillium canariense]KAJ5152964.1 hypothetical protein N7482_009442 [Penicillium canariense]